MLAPEQIPKLDDFLRGHGLEHYPMIQDVGTLIKQEMKHKPKNSQNKVLTDVRDFDYSVYHPLAEVRRF